MHCFDLSCNGCTERIGCMLFRRDVDSADLTWPSALLEKEMLQHWCCHPSSFDGINESAWAHSLVMGGQYIYIYIRPMALKFSSKFKKKKTQNQNPGVIRGGALFARFVGSVLSAKPMNEF